MRPVHAIYHTGVDRSVTLWSAHGRYTSPPKPWGVTEKDMAEGRVISILQFKTRQEAERAFRSNRTVVDFRRTHGAK